MNGYQWINIYQAPSEAELSGVDYINSVCPCAGLSMLNVSQAGGAARGADAEKNKWMFESAEYVLDRVKPRVMSVSYTHLTLPPKA